MKFILLIFIATIFFNGCTPIETKPLGKPTSETTTHNSYDYRWIDNTDKTYNLETHRIDDQITLYDGIRNEVEVDCTVKESSN